ncbi:piggyBac transposable element-derived protein 4-like [Lineus longissimus]|uniref:piggyBac transposable element-derived protein 4-like n=1 Tax=Lineus longissimus TaxID=88925 RepID=UPI00315D27BF
MDVEGGYDEIDETYDNDDSTELDDEEGNDDDVDDDNPHPAEAVADANHGDTAEDMDIADADQDVDGDQDMAIPDADADQDFDGVADAHVDSDTDVDDPNFFPAAHDMSDSDNSDIDRPLPDDNAGDNVRGRGDDFLDDLVENTNLHAAKTMPPDVPDPANPYATSHKEWKTTTTEEMKAFIGINILMGIKQVSDYRDFWSQDTALRDEYITSKFPRRAYERLCRFIHCSNPNQVNANDRLDKVRPLITVLDRTFPAMFEPDSELSIDEAMVKFNGRLVWKQYMPKKPIKWGMKIWCLCDSKTGYCLAFSVYTGAGDNDDAVRIFGLGYAVVMRLMHDYLLSNHKLFADNFFSSVTLAEDLSQADTYYTGTARVKFGGLKEDLCPVQQTTPAYRGRELHPDELWV